MASRSPPCPCVKHHHYYSRSVAMTVGMPGGASSSRDDNNVLAVRVLRRCRSSVGSRQLTEIHHRGGVGFSLPFSLPFSFFPFEPSVDPCTYYNIKWTSNQGLLFSSVTRETYRYYRRNKSSNICHERFGKS